MDCYTRNKQNKDKEECAAFVSLLRASSNTTTAGKRNEEKSLTHLQYRRINE